MAWGAVAAAAGAVQVGAVVDVRTPPPGGLALARVALKIRSTSGKLSARTAVSPSFLSTALPGSGEVLAGTTTIALAADRRSGTLTGLVGVVVRGPARRAHTAAGRVTVSFGTADGDVSLAGPPASAVAPVSRVGRPTSGSLDALCGFHARTMAAALHDLVGVRSSNPGFASVIGMRPADVVSSAADVFCHLPGYDAPADFLSRIAPGYRRPAAHFALAVTPTVPASNGVGHVTACLHLATTPAQKGAVAEIHIKGRGVGVGADQNLPLGDGGAADTHFSLHADGPFTVTVTLFTRDGAVKTAHASGTFDHTATTGPAGC